ncbi:MAG: DNA helicase [Pelagimonas sp.]|uniref:DNA helicase n=1 Tax=Pelagimonas sp. TaxID=2073170 RepID=UPI003D6C2BFF
MDLSSPIFILKRAARKEARLRGIPLHQSLTEAARREGFSNWSELARTYAKTTPAIKILESLRRGELVLLAARPGHGKTLHALDLLLCSLRRGKQAWFFSLEYCDAEILERVKELDGMDQVAKLAVDTTDDICASYIEAVLISAQAGSVVVIDYLQIMDQRRHHPPLADQVAHLKALAKKRQITVVAISQVDRGFEQSRKRLPDLSDVRLPNPVDLTLFDKACFIHDGRVRITPLP